MTASLRPWWAAVLQPGGFAARAPIGATVAAAIALELFLAWAIRDNLTLNVLMLLYSVAAIKSWQAGA